MHSDVYKSKDHLKIGTPTNQPNVSGRMEIIPFPSADVWVAYFKLAYIPQLKDVTKMAGDCVGTVSPNLLSGNYLLALLCIHAWCINTRCV